MGFLHYLAKFCLTLLTSMTVWGTENIPANGATLMVMNHLHWLDPIVALAVIRRPAVMLTAEKWERTFFIGHVMRWSQRAIFVQRGEPDRTALKRALEVLQRGEMLGISPEGTRSRTGGLQQAHDGPAYLVTRTGATIAPVVVYGQEHAEQYWRKLRRPRIMVVIGEPFRFTDTPAHVRSRDLQPYTDAMMRHLAQLLPEAYRGVYPLQAGDAPTEAAA